jgi:hypothetical protein
MSQERWVTPTPLPPQFQAAVAWETESPDTLAIYWHMTKGDWAAETAPGKLCKLSPRLSQEILRALLRGRRDEPHLCFPNGHAYFYLNPESSWCTLADLEQNIQGKNRYAGAVPWTVAQHHRLCEALVRIWWEKPGPGVDDLRALHCSMENAVHALRTHDLAEGVVHDLNVGLKRALRAHELRTSNRRESSYDYMENQAEAWVQARIRPKITWSAPLTFFKDWIDRRAAWVEMTHFRFDPVWLEEAEDRCDGKNWPLRDEEQVMIRTIRCL